MRPIYEQEKLRIAADQARSLKRIADALEAIVKPTEFHLDSSKGATQAPVMVSTPASQFPAAERTVIQYHDGKPYPARVEEPDDDEVEPMGDEDEHLS